MSSEIRIERFFEAVIHGERDRARELVEGALAAGMPAERILNEIFWPTLETADKMHRHDQLSKVCLQYATRILRMLVGQMQLQLAAETSRGKRVMVVGGPDEVGELSGQMASDLLEAEGYEVFFTGGGVASDEILAQVGELRPDMMVLFGSGPSDLPYIRQSIDTLHATGTCPRMQIVVGGGVFNRAEGLAEEIGADLWARTPEELVDVMQHQPERRMPVDQRTVGSAVCVQGKPALPKF